MSKSPLEVKITLTDGRHQNSITELLRYSKLIWHIVHINFSILKSYQEGTVIIEKFCKRLNGRTQENPHSLKSLKRHLRFELGTPSKDKRAVLSLVRRDGPSSFTVLLEVIRLCIRHPFQHYMYERLPVLKGFKEWRI